MTPSTSVRIEPRGRIALIVIDNPPVNASSHAVRSGLADAVARAGILGATNLAAAPKAAPPDGPENGRWVRGEGKRYGVPAGVIYRLIAHFWGRDWAEYDNLVGDDAVFEDPVENQTVRSKASAANKELKRIGIPWRLSANSEARVVRKQPTT